MYCWIEPQCGCSICIGPPRGLAKVLPISGLPGAPVRRTPQPRSPFRLPSLPFTSLSENKNRRGYLEGYELRGSILVGSQTLLRGLLIIGKERPESTLNNDAFGAWKKREALQLAPAGEAEAGNAGEQPAKE